MLSGDENVQDLSGPTQNDTRIAAVPEANSTHDMVSPLAIESVEALMVENASNETPPALVGSLSEAEPVPAASINEPTISTVHVVPAVMTPQERLGQPQNSGVQSQNSESPIPQSSFVQVRSSNNGMPHGQRIHIQLHNGNRATMSSTPTPIPRRPVVSSNQSVNNTATINPNPPNGTAHPGVILNGRVPGFSVAMGPQIIIQQQGPGQIQLPPLQPQPAPASLIRNRVASRSAMPTAEEMKEKLPQFVCSICSDFMDEPAKCGEEKCTGRFCLSCIERVISSAQPSQQHQQNASHSPGPKCPFCRSCLKCKSKKITMDEALRAAMDGSALVSCSHAGCTRLLELRKVKAHETECDKVIVQCRYASFGCKWIGPKHALPLHETLPGAPIQPNQSSQVGRCSYYPVAGLIAQLRSLRVLHDIRIQHLQQHLAGVTQSLGSYNQMRSSFAVKYSDDICDILSCLYTALCHPTSFLLAKDTTWVNMFRAPEARGSIYNALVCFPMFMLVFKSLVKAIETIYDVLPIGESTSSVNYEVLASIVIPLILFVLGTVTMVCFQIDKSDSMSWARFTIANDLAICMARDLAAISLAMFIHVWVTDSFNSLWVGLVASCYLMVTSEIIPHTLSIILATAAIGNADPSEVKSLDYLSSSKARKVVLFGIRYGSLISGIGLLEAMDSTLILGMIQQYLLNTPFPLSPFISLGETDCFLAELNFGYIATARAASAFALQPLGFNHAHILVAAIRGAAILCLMNMTVYAVRYVGTELGYMIAQKALAHAARGRSGPQASLPIIWTGRVVYALWLVGLTCVILAR